MSRAALTERTSTSLYEFCARARDADAIGALEKSLGVRLPGPGMTARTDGVTALWTGEQRWLIHADTGLEAAVPMASAWRVFSVSGPGAVPFLAAHCPLELDLPRFPAGACRTTLFDQCRVVIDRVDANRFEIYVARSFARDFLERFNLPGARQASAT